MQKNTKEVLRGLSARIGEIRYALKGVALDEEENRDNARGARRENESESLSIAASLLEEAVSSINAAIGE